MEPKFLTIAVAVCFQAAGGVWWLASLDSRVSHNDFPIQVIDRSNETDHDRLSEKVAENSRFVKLWPAGKWGSGSLPDDVRQNLKISIMEKQIDKIIGKLYNGDTSNP